MPHIQKKQSYITHSNLLLFRWNKRFQKNWLNFPSISHETLLSCVWLMPSLLLPNFIVFLSKNKNNFHFFWWNFVCKIPMWTELIDAINNSKYRPTKLKLRLKVQMTAVNKNLLLRGNLSNCITKYILHNIKYIKYNH